MADVCSNPECGVALRVGEVTAGQCFDCQYVAMLLRNKDRKSWATGR